jgi:PKD repeat protein
MVSTVPYSYTRYFNTSDLATWTLNATSTGASPAAAATDVAYGANRFVAVGYNGTSTRNEMSFSTDGITWSAAATVGSTGTSIPLNRIVWGGGKFDIFSIGGNGSADTAKLATRGYIQASRTFYYSADATSWTAGTLPYGAHWTDVQSNGSTTIAVAEGGEDTGTQTYAATANFITSTDGVNWTARTLPTTGSWGSVAQLGNSWLISNPYDTSAYAAASATDMPGLSSSLFVIAQQKITSTSTTFESAARYDWDSASGMWKIAKWFPATNISQSANFSFSPNGTINTGTTVTFTDSSTGDISARVWDFGDGTTSTSQNPTHSYAMPGVYTVTLSTTQSSGVTVATSQTVTIGGAASAPVNLKVASTSGTTISITWEPPIDNGTSSITGYLVEKATSATGPWTTVTTTTGSTYAYTLTGLTSNVTYYVRVTSQNSITGGGSASQVVTSATTVPCTLPTAPGSFQVTGSTIIASCARDHSLHWELVCLVRPQQSLCKTLLAL